MWKDGSGSGSQYILYTVRSGFVEYKSLHLRASLKNMKWADRHLKQQHTWNRSQHTRCHLAILTALGCFPQFSSQTWKLADNQIWAFCKAGKKCTTRKHRCYVVIKWTGGFILPWYDGNWKATIKSESYRVQISQARILQLKQTVCATVEETGCVNKSTGGLWPIVHMQLQSDAGGVFVIRALGLRNKQPEETKQTQSELSLKPHLVL